MTKPQPKTIYQIASKEFSTRTQAALEAAQNGNFEQLETLEEEVADLLSHFINHGLFLHQQRRWIEVPGSKESDMAELMAQVEAYKATQATRAQDPPQHTE